VSFEAAVLAAEGHPEEAFAAARRSLEIYGPAGGQRTWLRFMAFEAGAAVDDSDMVRSLLGLFEGVPVGELTRTLRAQQARFRARLPEHDAEVELATAERLFRELGAPFYAAVVQVEHAEWLAAHGRAAEAKSHLDEARETFERLEAAPWLERATAAAGEPQAHVPA
jgi:hypothetical protein